MKANGSTSAEQEIGPGQVRSLVRTLTSASSDSQMYQCGLFVAMSLDEMNLRCQTAAVTSNTDTQTPPTLTLGRRHLVNAGLMLQRVDL